jgi:transcriptional regulator GlxA family with amidase domain
LEEGSSTDYAANFHRFVPEIGCNGREATARLSNLWGFTGAGNLWTNRDAGDRRVSARINHMDPRVRAVIDLMNQQFQRKLSVDELAETVQLSPSRLRHLFKHETGTSLMRHLRNLRMERAKDLLETTFLSVKEVAARGGIASVSHFVRDFEKTYGHAPTTHRAMRAKAHKPHLGHRNSHNG